MKNVAFEISNVNNKWVKENELINCLNKSK